MNEIGEIVLKTNRGITIKNRRKCCSELNKTKVGLSNELTKEKGKSYTNFDKVIGQFRGLTRKTASCKFEMTP